MKKSDIVSSTQNDGEQMVEIFLMKDNERYKNDLFVCVNGVGIMVPRGENVKIKKKYADVIKRSLEESNAASSFVTNLESKNKEN